MRAMLVGFALGIVSLQQRATLPGRWQWAALAVLFVAACGMAVWVRASPAIASVRSSTRGTVAPWAAWCRSIATPAALAGAAVVAGYAYAAVRAEIRLAEALPNAWELRELALTGHVRGLPTQDTASARFLFAVDVDDVRRRTGIERFPSIVQLNWAGRGGHGMSQLKPGDRWRLMVRLKRPHGHANFAVHDAEVAWLARGVRATGYVVAGSAAKRLPGTAGGIGTAIGRLRFALRERMAQVLDGAAHGGIVTALAIGTQDAIAAVDRLALRRTGTSHLVAVSGLHIGFVAGLCAALAAWLWRRSCLIGAMLARRGTREWPLVLPTPIVAAAAAVASAAGYAVLAGFNVPAQRALWMLVAVSVAFVLGRSVAFSLVLAWAAALVLIVDPWAVTAAGFWLSFGAVALIAFAMRGRLRVREEGNTAHDALDAARASDPTWMAPPVQADGVDRPRSRWRRRLARARRRCADAIRAQWAVTIGLAPLTAFWFSQVSLVGPLANAIAVPWVSVLVVPVVLVAIALPAPLDALAYQLAHALLEPLMHVLHALAQSPWADRHPPRPSLSALGAALAGVAWCLMPRGWPLRFAAPLAWLPLVVPGAPRVEEGAFRLTALDVGQGTSILVETRRRALLFDAGPGPESTNAGERIVAPYLRANGVSRLDALVVSHGDADHAGGVPAVIASAQVRQMLGGLPPMHRAWDAARGPGTDRLRCAAGQRWHWDGVEFEMLWPDPGPLPRQSNEQSCVLKVSAHGVSALLTGDIGAPAERVLVSRASEALRADVLLVAHHGSKTSSTEPFLDSVDPRIAVFQVGYRNRFRHPHPSVWSRFDARGASLARTDRDGAVRVAIENGRPTLERYRVSHARYWMDR
ncbi:DNA internalization-related competence protein ComEC/Rec2 [Trinickia acidisoli]|uniref:DNA internalization-related competence protein ComEC/Rec2 n=1 Tax=Trinickia acidisoli TaxID=2767482 RepID=UPI001A8DA65E|nr:DNA internalization-related competence protein ComEC/Rec2 [Trinickia acidisoli]